MSFTSGLRHSFFGTGDLLPSTMLYIGRTLNWLGLMAVDRLASVQFLGDDEAPGDQLIEKLAKLQRTLFLTDLIFGQQGIADLLEALRVRQMTPNGGSDLVESEALACLGIECDQLIAELGFHEIDGAAIYWAGQELSLWTLVSPAGFEPATY